MPIATCPKVSTHTVRIEGWGSERTAFCLACMKHFPLCTATQFMNICEL